MEQGLPFDNSKIFGSQNGLGAKQMKTSWQKQQFPWYDGSPSRTGNNWDSMQRQSQRIDLTDDPLSLKPSCCHLADSNHIVDSTTLYQTLTATEAETEAGQGQQAPPVRSLATSLSTSKAIIIFSPLSLTRSLGTTRAMFFFIAIIDKKSEFYQSFSSLT